MSGDGWTRPGYEAVARLVRERTGLLFAQGVRKGVEARIEQAMSERAVPDPRRFLELIASDDAAFDSLVALLTVGETYFFREPAQLEYIRTEVLPGLVRRRGRGAAVRAWSAGCASGEEPYSLAILLRELGLAAPSTVVGTDISQERLERARKAVYSRWSLRGVPEETVRRYFRQWGNQYELVPEIRSAVTFRRLNLADDDPSPASGIVGMDLVLCRNVLIYLDPRTVARAARRLMDSLGEDGWLFLGASDPPLAELVPCEVVVTGAGVAYRHSRRRAVAAPAPLPPRRAPTDVAPAPERTRRSPAAPPPAAPAEPAASGEGADREAAREAAACYAARDYQRAAKMAERALEQGAGDPDTWTVRVRALANLGKLEEAGRACSAALDLHRTSAELACLHALLLSAAGHHAEASSAARQALYLDRDMAVAHLALGNILLRRQDRQGARRALQNAERLLQALPAEAIVPASDGEPAGRLLELVRRQLKLVAGAA